MTVNAVATVPRSVFVDGQAPVRYLVRSDRGFRKEVEFLLLGPYGPPGGSAMKLLRLISEYRWPIYLGGLLAMSVIACGVLVWVATRPDAPRPIKGYYEAAQAWDADEAVEDGEPPARVVGPLRAALRRAPRPGHAAAGGRPCRRPRREARRRGSRAACSPSARRTPASTSRANSSRCRRRPGATGRSCASTRPGPGSCASTSRQEALRFVHAARLTVPAEPAIPEGANR